MLVCGKGGQGILLSALLTNIINET